MASTYISRSISSSPTNPDKFTVSFWVKRCRLGVEQTLIGQYASANFRGKLGFVGDDRIEYIQKNDGNTTANLITTRKFRDNFGWYNIIVQFDTSQGTASNRIKIYVNGVQETAFDTASYPAQDLDMRLNQASGTLCIGQDGNSSNYCDVVLSHFHLVDGATEAPTVFGSVDNDTGEWKINTSPTISEYGDDGFFVLKDGNSVTDQSGKGNNFTVGGGTLTKTEDCPSNVFPIFTLLDPVTHSYNGGTSNGGTSIQSTTNEYPYLITNMGANKGKFYWEMKISATSSGSGDTEAMIGIVSTRGDSTTQELGHHGNDYGYYAYDGKYRTGDTSTAYGNTFGLNDIIGVAMDLDNNKLYFSKNGTWQNSGVPTSGSTGTGAISITDPDSTEVGFYVPAVCVWSSGVNSTFQANFGNGYFGTTAVATNSGNGYQDADGNGIMNYSVPTNYRCLSTKGLNQ